MSRWVMIGVPSSAGAHHAGQDRAPEALRQAGLLDQARSAGVDIKDAGDLPGAVFAADPEHPHARNLEAVVRVAGETADAVAGHLDSGRLPLVVGGDCTITLGVIAGFRRQHPDVGLVYVDGDADLGTPGTDGSGIFDAMGIAHLLGRGAPELAGLGGAPPLLTASRLALVGGDPRETNQESRAFLAEAGVSFQEGPALIADPVGTAERAIAGVAAASGPVVVHFDVDAIDSGDLPLGNFPHYGSGVQLEHAAAALRALRAHPSFAGLVLTEVNPSYDPGGSQLDRYINAIVSVLAG
ncbi:MAG TPA: arginase family protein [Streptosporangiaceae bacterium]|jgi:arginase